MKRLLYILTFIGSLLYSQEYCAGEQISSAHQNQTFNVCYGECDCEGWSLSDYAGDIIFLDLSASWCSPCFSSIDIIDELEEYWSDENPNVRFVTALSDIGQPYSCNEWGSEGVLGSPLIVEDDSTLFNWFKDSNGQYPSYVLIDHTMTVRAKPSNMFSNSNDESCDGSEYMDSLDSDCLNSMITDLLDQCGDGCSSEEGCSDESACNNGDSADCIYPQENYDCCGECAVETDCLGVCGGDATEEECGSTTFECNLPTCHLVSPDSEIYPTIQSGINAAQDGDTVLVEQGTYYENLLLDKEITLTSRAIFDDLNGWIGYEDSYVILNDNITGTIIDGSMDTNGDDRQSTILINSPDECIECTIFGFTITGGDGTRATVDDVEKTLGGGILSNNALPKINYNFITNNKGDVEAGGLDEGGALNMGSGVDLGENVLGIRSNHLRCDGDVDLSYNFYRDNDADYGNTFGTNDFEGSVDMSNSIFDVYNCPEEEVTTVWVDVEEGVDVDFNNGVGDLCSITEDVWVSPTGDDNNLGTSDTETFLTIKRALEMIAPDNSNRITINLTDGVFSPSTTAENFPIIMIPNVNLIGQGEDLTTLDAEETDGVILLGSDGAQPDIEGSSGINNCRNNTISDLTVSGGTRGSGGGIHISTCTNTTFKNLTLSNNSASSGGGMYLYKSSVMISYSKFINNYANAGGGICSTNGWGTISDNVRLIIQDVIFEENHKIGGGRNATDQRYDGGSAVAFYSGYIEINNSQIINNQSNRYGAVYLQGSNGGPNVFLNQVLIAGNYGSDYGGAAISMSQQNGNSMTLTNVTISDNSMEESCTYGCAAISMFATGDLTINNSIIWNNDVQHQINQTNNNSTTQLNVSYSDIQYGQAGIDAELNYNWLEGNIDEDPLFTNPGDMDYSLGTGSECIDKGNPDIWYNDIDKSRSDMGATGGLFVKPNFTAYDFSEVGALGLFTEFSLLNYRETPITIDSVEFATPSFTTNTSFSPPMTIYQGETGIIDIQANHQLLGLVEDNMVIHSSELPESLSVALQVLGSEENIIGGLIFDTIQSLTYKVTENLIIPEGVTVTIEPGAVLSFNEDVGLIVLGTLLAVGTEQENIIFDGYDNVHWGSIQLDTQGSNEESSIINYVKILNGTGLEMRDSNPIITNVHIEECEGTWNDGSFIAGIYGDNGALHLEGSNPTISNIVLDANIKPAMFLQESNPTINNVVITETKIYEGYYLGSITLNESNPIMSNIIIRNNQCLGDMSYYCFPGIYLNKSNPIMTEVLISENTLQSEYSPGATMYLENSDPIMNRCTISENEFGIDWGGNLSGDEILISPDSNPIIVNSIIWNSTDSDIIRYDWRSLCIDVDYDTCIEYSDLCVWYDSGSGWCDMGNDPDNNPDFEYDNIITAYNSNLSFNDYVSGEGNIYNQDPLFIDSNNGNFGLLQGSPCIDAGIANLELNGQIIVNYDVTDYSGSAPDMGAYELYQEISGCIDETACNFNVYANTDDGSCLYNDCTGECGGSAQLDECGQCGGDNSSCTDCCGVVNGAGDTCDGECGPCNDDIDEGTCDCAGNVLDECGECGGNGPPCFLLGDINGDGVLNVLDIVLLANMALASEYDEIGDMNSDGILNVLDIVLLVNSALGNDLARGDATTEVTVYYGNEKIQYTADGNLAGIQFEVIGDYTITDNSLPDGWEIVYNESIILLYSINGSSLTDKTLFEYTGDFKIESVIAADWFESAISVSTILIPKEFNLSPAYPNPFNPTTTLNFDLPEESTVSLSIYNLQGREVSTLISGYMYAGYHSVVWNADSYSSGVYFVKMVAGEYVSTQKLMLVK